MAGPFWEPLSPSSSTAQGFSRPHSIWICFVPCPYSSFSPCPVWSAQSSDTPTFPFSPLKGSSPRLAGLGCLDLLPTPRRRSFSTAPQEARAVGKGGGILDRWSGPSSQVSWRSGHSRADQGAYPVAALPACQTERPGRLAAHCTPFPFGLFPAFKGGRIAFPPVAVWGRWGGAEELGLRREGSRCPH